MSRRWTPPRSHEQLLSAARQLIDEGREEKYRFAVVMAQAACEVLTEQVMAALIERVQPESLREWVGEAVKHRNGFHVDRVRNLYTALTGDQIKMGEGLWQQYKKHAERRHRVVHGGGTSVQGRSHALLRDCSAGARLPAHRADEHVGLATARKCPCLLAQLALLNGIASRGRSCIGRTCPGQRRCPVWCGPSREREWRSRTWRGSPADIDSRPDQSRLACSGRSACTT